MTPLEIAATRRRAERWREHDAAVPYCDERPRCPAMSGATPTTDTTVPQLAWLLGDRADKAFAAVEKFDAAAAVERKKAADEKTAVRLARKKAKLEQERAAGEAVSSLPDDLSDRDVV